MVIFTFELFVEISSLISLPILRGVCKVGSELYLGRSNVWNSIEFWCLDKSKFSPKLP